MRHLACEVAFDHDLWDALQEWRADTARAASLPDFVVLTDATLRAVAERHPADLTELGRIAGISAIKLTRYGGALLDVLAAYPEERDQPG
jgi:DNA helicase-2/ATP-dependent DNA helicase PcrA